MAVALSELGHGLVLPTPTGETSTRQSSKNLGVFGETETRIFSSKGMLLVPVSGRTAYENSEVLSSLAGEHASSFEDAPSIRGEVVLLPNTRIAFSNQSFDEQQNSLVNTNALFLAHLRSSARLGIFEIQDYIEIFRAYQEAFGEALIKDSGDMSFRTASAYGFEPEDRPKSRVHFRVESGRIVTHLGQDSKDPNVGVLAVLRPGPKVNLA
jgi:hypothetical protein